MVVNGPTVSKDIKLPLSFGSEIIPTSINCGPGDAALNLTLFFPEAKSYTGGLIRKTVSLFIELVPKIISNLPMFGKDCGTGSLNKFPMEIVALGIEKVETLWVSCNHPKGKLGTVTLSKPW